MSNVEQLYKERYRIYVSIMSRILSDHAAAEDVVQEAFCRALKFQGSYNSERGKISSWFNTILFNSLKDIQNEMRWNTVELGPNITAEDLLINDIPLNSPEGRELIKKRISSYNNPQHARVLELFFVLGYTSTEIHQIENKVSVSNVTTIVTRFRLELVDELKWSSV